MTHQISDILIYESQEYHLENELLEKYFAEFPEKKPERKIVESCIWRGYIATFEIVNNELQVKDIQLLLNSSYESNSIVDQVFPKNNKFEWFSGLIYLNSSKKNSDENNLEFLEIRNGNFIRKRTMNSEELQRFKIEQFQFFIISEDVKPIYNLYKKNNPGITEETINELIFQNILFFTKEVYVD